MKHHAIALLLVAASCGGGSSRTEPPPAFQPSPNIAATHGYLQGLYMGEIEDASGLRAIAFLDLFDEFPADRAAPGEMVVGAPFFGTTAMQLEADDSDVRLTVGDAVFVGTIEWPDLVLTWTSTTNAGAARFRKTYAD